MTASPWTFTTSARTKLINGTFDIDTDTWNIALFKPTSNLGASSTTYAALTNEIAQANGYLTGGTGVTLAMTGTTSVAVAFDPNPYWTANGGIITAHSAALYEVGGDVLAYSVLDEDAVTVTDADWGAPSGNDVTITSAGANLPLLIAGVHFTVSAHSNTNNNGIYIATGTPTASSLPSTKLTGSAPVNTAAESVDMLVDVAVIDGSILLIDSNGVIAPIFSLA